MTTLRYRIEQDSDPQSPEDNGNTDLFLLANHRQFSVERKEFPLDSIKDNLDDYHVLPLYAYIHSGITLSMARSCPWDSGQVGYIMISRTGGFTDIEKAAQSLCDEWNQYLSGDVYGYTVELQDDDTGEWEHIDSCWGFYGREYCEQEAKEQLAWHTNHLTTEDELIDRIMHV